MFAPIQIKEIRALRDHVLVSNMNFKERVTSGGIQLLSDDGRSAGVRPRWAQIYAVGPDQMDVRVGQWILVKHGRWTRGVMVEAVDGEHTLRRVDARDILLVSDTEPTSDDTQSQEKLIDAKDRW